MAATNRRPIRVLIAVVALLLGPCVALVNVTESASPHLARFEKFKRDFHRHYRDASEEALRLHHFTENMETAAALQKLNPFARFGVNNYSDYSKAEFKKRHNAERAFQSAAKRRAVANNTVHVPRRDATQQAIAIDWRTRGVVTGVKNQGDCGSCWSFSTTGNIEGQWAKAGNALVSLSEQELVSCDYTNSACSGGLMDRAFEWLLETQGGRIVSEATYPYVSGAGYVPACPAYAPTSAAIAGYVNLPSNEAAMATWMINGGPISIGVDASSWQTYTGGILTACGAQAVDHGVLAVGFDEQSNPPYWIIKNSWGAAWGEAGYIRLQMGVDACLITSGPSSSYV